MKNNPEVLPFPIIVLATHGDVMAMNEIIKHFEQYMMKLSQKTLFDEYDNPLHSCRTRNQTNVRNKANCSCT